MTWSPWLVLGLGAALAEAPNVVRDGDVVRVSAALDTSGARVLAALRDPGWEGRVAGDGTVARITGADGDCQIVAYTSPNAIATATYVLRRCPTADGWQSTLIESSTFTAYRSRWTVTPQAVGCRVSFEVDMQVSAWVPDVLVQSETMRSLQKRMAAVQAWAGAQPKE